MPQALAALPIKKIVAWIAIYVITYALTPKPKSYRQPLGLLQPSAGTILPWRVLFGKSRVAGAIFFQRRAALAVPDGGVAGATYLYQAHALACHQIEDVIEVWNRDALLIDSGDWSGSEATYSVNTPSGAVVALRVIKHLGADDQAVDTKFDSNLGTTWTVDHRARGRAYVACILTDDSALWPDGMPELTFLVKGANQILDTRTGTEGYTANAALCIAHYLYSPRFGVAAGTKTGTAPNIHYTEINETVLTANANACDDSVDHGTGGFQPRYECNGGFEVDGAHDDILRSLATSCAGTVVYNGGVWEVHAGMHSAAVATLTEADLVGPVRIQPRLPINEVFNRVKGVFQSSAAKYQPTDYPLVKNDTYATQDGKTILRDLDLPFTTDPYACQRIAKIELEDSRQQIVVELQCNMAAYRFVPPDRVALTLPRYGWSAKLFRVLETTLEISEGEAPTMSVRLLLKETAAGVYSWAGGEETTVDLSPDTDLGDLFTIATPQNLQVVGRVVGNNLDRFESQAVVTWDAPASAENVEQYEVEIWLGSAPGGTLIDTRLVQRERRVVVFGALDPLAPTGYTVRARAVAYNGVVSAWVSFVNFFPLHVVNSSSGVPNMLRGGDFPGEKNIWQELDPATESPVNPNALVDVGGFNAFASKTNITDGSDATSSDAITERASGVNTECAVDCTWAPATKSGRLRVVAESVYSGQGFHQVYLEVNTGAGLELVMPIWTPAFGKFELSKNLGLVALGSLTARIRSLRASAGSRPPLPADLPDGLAKLYGLTFLELTGPYSIISDSVCEIVGDGTAYGDVRRPYPGREGNATGGVVHAVGGPGLMTIIAMRRKNAGAAILDVADVPTPVDVRLEDDQGAVHTVLSVAGTDILDDWRWYALWHSPTTDIENELEAVCRTKSKNPVEIDKWFHARGNLIQLFRLSSYEEERGAVVDDRTPPPVGHYSPAGPWQVGVYKIAET